MLQVVFQQMNLTEFFFLDHSDPLKCCTLHRCSQMETERVKFNPLGHYLLLYWSQTPHGGQIWIFCIMLETVVVEQSEAKCAMWLLWFIFQLEPTSVLEILSTHHALESPCAVCPAALRDRSVVTLPAQRCSRQSASAGVLSASCVFEFSISTSLN